MFKEIIIGWLTFVLALFSAVVIIVAVGAFVIWVFNLVDDIAFNLRMRKWNKNVL